VADFLLAMASLLTFAIYPLLAFAVIWVARRRPWTMAIAIGIAVACGTGAIWYAAQEGFGYQWASGRVEFGSDEGRHSFEIGFVLVVLGCPAWLLVAAARIKNGDSRGPRA
jgi:hypothetical protein